MLLFVGFLSAWMAAHWSLWLMIVGVQGFTESQSQNKYMKARVKISIWWSDEL